MPDVGHSGGGATTQETSGGGSGGGESGEGSGEGSGENGGGGSEDEFSKYWMLVLSQEGSFIQQVPNLLLCNVHAYALTTVKIYCCIVSEQCNRG